MKNVLFSVSLFFLSFNLFAVDFYQIEETTIEGKKIKMDQFKDKVILIVNIASQCGFTSQLGELESLYQKYKDKGLVVLGVPTNDFGEQTPENDSAMKEFCSKKYQVSFPLLKKETILGKQQRPLYRHLTQETPESIRGDVGWNFVKFLVNRKGVVVDRFTSFVGPLSGKVTGAIESNL